MYIPVYVPHTYYDVDKNSFAASRLKRNDRRYVHIIHTQQPRRDIF